VLCDGATGGGGGQVCGKPLREAVPLSGLVSALERSYTAAAQPKVAAQQQRLQVLLGAKKRPASAGASAGEGESKKKKQKVAEQAAPSAVRMHRRCRCVALGGEAGGDGGAIAIA